MSCAGAFAEVDGIHSVLTRPGARIADVGTGAGWSSIALARAYPDLQVDGFDVDDPSIELARANAAEAGVSDRVRFHNADGDGLSNFGRFDAAFAFECIHDMPRPVDVLAAMRLAVRDDGPVIVMDEAVAETFTAPGDDLERIMYGYSLFVCLPDSLSHRPSVGDGHRHAPRHPPRVRAGGGLRRPRDPADRGLQLLPLLLADALTARRRIARAQRASIEPAGAPSRISAARAIFST